MSPIVVETTPWRGKPLCRLGDLLLAGRRGRLLLYREGERAPVARYSLPLPRWKALCCRVRLLERLVHGEIRWALPLDKDTALLLCGEDVLRFDVKTGTFQREEVRPRGKPLSALALPRASGAPEVLLGDYGANPRRESVRIYRRSGESGAWAVAYTFPAGMVRHIHGLVRDEYRKKLYVLTGDEDGESGIWAGDEDLSELVPVFTGSQQARSCQLLPTAERLLYLTDAPSEPNRLMEWSNGKAEALSPIRGSVIYGLPLGDGLLFSTTVEPEAHAPNRVSYYLSNRPGAGIRDNRVEICHLLPSGEIQVLERFRHDRLPLRLFQYAAAAFCADGEGGAYYAPCCVRGADQRIRRLRGRE